MMADKQHRYAVKVTWKGNTGGGTRSTRGYEHAHDISSEGEPTIAGSSDPRFGGDPGRWNPEELLVASLSACHKLWFLGLCSQSGVVVTAYEDCAEGSMTEDARGAGQFSAVVLRPRVTISADSDAATAAELHHQAHAMCFIARSVSFPVSIEAATSQEAVPMA